MLHWLLLFVVAAVLWIVARRRRLRVRALDKDFAVALQCIDRVPVVDTSGTKNHLETLLNDFRDLCVASYSVRDPGLCMHLQAVVAEFHRSVWKLRQEATGGSATQRLLDTAQRTVQSKSQICIKEAEGRLGAGHTRPALLTSSDLDHLLALSR